MVSDAPLSSGVGEGGLLSAGFVFPHASDGSVGEVSFVGAAGFAAGLAFGEFAVDVVAGEVEVALLGDAGDVEHAVDSAVAAEVESVSDGLVAAFAGGDRDRAGAAPAGELGFAGEPERVTGLDEQGGGVDCADPALVTQCGAVFVEEPVEFAFELADLAATGTC